MTTYRRKKSMNGLAFFGAFSGVALIFVGGSLFRGYTLSVLWGWFIVPVFGLPILTIPQAIGLSIVVTFLVHSSDSSSSSDEDLATMILTGMLQILFKNLLVLLFAWVVHGFI